MKKQYVQMLIIAILLLSLVGSIMRCQQRADAPPKEIIESAEEASRQVPKASHSTSSSSRSQTKTAHAVCLLSHALCKVLGG